MSIAEDILVFVDDFYLSGMSLVFAGWLISPEILVNAALLLGSDAKFSLTNFNLPSEDVAHVYGPAGKNVRFKEIFPLHPDLQVRSFGQAQLSMTTRSGRTLRQNITSSSLSHCCRHETAPRATLGSLRIGIGITTYNRRSILSQTLDKIESNSRFGYDLVVADDGSEDGTVDMLRRRRVPVITGKNRGVAWNKNRALFFLSMLKKCDVVILLEDDTYPDRVGWESHWIVAATLYGHCNFAPPWFGAANRGGFGQWFDPSIYEGKVSGQCSAFSSEALSWVGFLDTRFGTYGFEHAEHSMRMVRAGFGGYLDKNNATAYSYYLINGGLKVAESVSSSTDARIRQNALVLHAIQQEGIFRYAWRTDDELKCLREEIAGAG